MRLPAGDRVSCGHDQRDDDIQALAVTFVGHATVLLEVDGRRVLTDPLLRLHVGPLIRRSPVPPASIHATWTPW